MKMLYRRLFVTALLCGIIGAVPAGAQPALQPLTLGLTSRTALELPTFVADRYGFFTANGIKPELVFVGVNSGVAQQLTGGSVDIGEVTTTQMVLAVEGGAPIVSIVNVIAGAPYYVIAKKGLSSIAQLKGKMVSIGGPSDITRIFMDTVFEKAGLKPDDWTYTFAGASTDRYAALVAGAIDATMLSPPLSFRAIAQGYPMIDEVPKYFPNFPFITWAVRQAWAKEHPNLVSAFVRAMLQASHWLADPANRQKAVALLAESTNTSVDDSAKSYDLFVTKLHLYSTNGTFTPKSYATVLQAMEKEQMIKAPLPPPSRFYDNHFAEQASAQIGK